MTQLLIACADMEVEGYKCTDLVRDGVYYGRPAEERLGEIRTYPIEKQYAVFICGMQFVRPPLWQVAQPLKDNGRATAEFLKTKLPSLRDDATIENVVELIYRIDLLGTYDVARDSELMEELDSVVSRIDHQAKKLRAADMLRQMRNP